MSGVSGVVAGMHDEWQIYREHLAEVERAARPDITDHHGRVWTWWKGDLYRHCSIAAPEVFLHGEQLGLPEQTALDNPNYVLCDLCLGGRVRSVRVCVQERYCRHATCKAARTAEAVTS